jgi:hypothetical protein
LISFKEVDEVIDRALLEVIKVWKLEYEEKERQKNRES